MKHVNRAIASASLLLAAFGTLGVSLALAQSDETTAEDVVEDGDALVGVEACADDDDCEADQESGTPIEEEAQADEMSAAPEAESVADDASIPASDGSVVVPGSTDESQPGGSTRPGTTPDT